MSGPALRRLFFAFWPDESIRRQIESAQFQRPDKSTTPRENWHMTLAFQGPTEAGQQRRLEQAAATVRAAPFEIQLDTTGYFAGARIGWLGCRVPNQALLDFQNMLEAALRERCPSHPAFGEDIRAYRPHLTLYRKIKDFPVIPLSEPIRWQLKSFSLIESRRGEKPVYQILNRWALSREALDK